MTEYEKLRKIIDEANELISLNVTSDDAQFVAWKNKVERFLINKYGKDSYEFNDFNSTNFTLVFYALGTPKNLFVQACKRGLEKSIEIFTNYLEDMEEDIKKDNIRKVEILDISKVFIVHGHDGELKHSVARLIEKQGIEAIILSEQVNLGKTIIEKIEEYSDVGAAICLFTADDYGNKKDLEVKNSRARQNVVFETGYFMGKLGRSNTIILADNDIEMPSDLSGVVYTSNNNWELDLLKELRQNGYKVDLNKLG